MKLRCHIKSGKITLDKQRWQDYLNSFDGDCTIEVKKYVKDRTIDQNKLYWSYLQIICDETGEESPTNLHELFKRTLLPPRFITAMGKKIKIPESTTRLDTKQFSEYMTKICSLTNVPIPSYDQI